MDRKQPKVRQFRPRPNVIEKRIHDLSADSVNVSWDKHTRQRMAERDISDVMIFDTLRSGFIKGDVIPGKNPEEWVAKLVKEQRGRREVGVVTVVIQNARLFIVTVEWEDMI